MAFLAPLPVGALTSRGNSSSKCTNPRRSRHNTSNSVQFYAKASIVEKYGHLKNADIPTVSDTFDKFLTAFGRPVPVVYRGIVNELLTATHLAIHCAMWRYDAIFAAGFEHIFEAFLSYYPNVDERTKLRQSMCDALGLDSAKLASDAASVAAFASDFTNSEDLFDKMTSTDTANSGDITTIALRAPLRKSDFEFYYSRCYGVGIITMMQAVGDELNADNSEKWAAKLGMEPAKLGAEVMIYNSAMERLKQAEQIFAEAAAREAKKTADRLARRAEAAQKKVEMLEAEEKKENSENVPATVTAVTEDK